MGWPYTAGEGISVSLGLGDFDKIDDTDTHVADYNSESTSGGGTTYHAKIQGWVAWYVLTDIVVAAGCVTAGGDALESGDALAAGQWHYGRYTTIKLTSGKIIAYRA